MKFRSTPVPADLVARKPSTHPHYQDCFRAIAESGAVPRVDLLARLLFSGASTGPIRRLAALGDRLSTRAVRKSEGWTRTAPSDDHPIRIGDKVGSWRVSYRNETEIVFHRPDRHLDFAFALRVKAAAKGFEVFATTLVDFHGIPGRLCFLPLKPFHRRIVPSLMDSVLAAATRGAPT